MVPVDVPPLLGPTSDLHQLNRKLYDKIVEAQKEKDTELEWFWLKQFEVHRKHQFLKENVDAWWQREAGDDGVGEVIDMSDNNKKRKKKKKRVMFDISDGNLDAVTVDENVKVKVEKEIRKV